MKPFSWLKSLLPCSVSSLALLNFLLSTPCLATSFIDQPFPDTIQDAPVIVRGKIGKRSVNWGTAADGGKQIYTFNDLDIEEVLKGQIEQKSIVIRELGGEKDGIGMHVAGASHFNVGEDVMVLLSEQNSEGSYNVRGLMMGKYNVERDATGTEYLIGPGISADETFDKKNDSPHPWTLDALRQVIRVQQKNEKENQTTTQNISPSSDQLTNHPLQQNVPQTSSSLTKSQAPQLQNPSEGELNHSQQRSTPERAHIYLGLTGGVAGFFALRALAARRRSQQSR